MFSVTIAYLKENSKIKENSYPEIRKTYIWAAKWGIDFYTGKYGIQ